MTTPAISIHVVTRETAGLLDDVDDDVFDNPVQPELLRAFLADPSNVLVVATVEGQVVGMATGVAYVHPDKPLALFINEVGVSSRFHRRGVGRMLMQRILAWGGEHGCTEAWVATEVSNSAACRLYESAGGLEDEEHAVVYVFRLAGGSVHPGVPSRQ
jgi:ribosomal protein S18 acetylase RimI-like enzyme